MSDALCKRVAALEQASSKARTLRIIVADFGESAEQALKREGVVPNPDQQVLVVLFGDSDEIGRIPLPPNSPMS